MAINLGHEKMRKQAADAVLEGNNDLALSVLNELLAQDEKNVDALLQRAHVYWLQGKGDEALADYKTAHTYDPVNTIAQKKIETLSLMSNKIEGRKRGAVVPVTSLLEEPGKAKAMKLSTLGKHEELIHLTVGEQLTMKVRRHKIELRDVNNIFVGYLPDDISKRLISFMEKGALYDAFLLAIDKTDGRVLIRERKKPLSLANTPSFPLENSEPPEEEDHSSKATNDEDDEDLDLEDESLIIHGESDDDEDDEEEKDQDDDTYREYEE